MGHRLHPGEFPDWSSYYREYQRRLVEEHLLPVLAEWGRWREGVSILDVGSGDGGAAMALAAAGARVDGIELDPRRASEAQEEARRRGLDLRFRVADVTRTETLDALPGPYDLVLFRDVLEHIPDRRAALRESRRRLGEGGGLMVVFPPYLSPYGGHQQILHPPRRLGLAWARLPWAHCLPRGLFHALSLRRDGSEDPEWEEIERIARARLTLAAMERDAGGCGLRLERERRYLLRPSFRLRYGTPVLDAGALGWIPGLREIAVSAAYQLWVVDQRA